VTPKREPEPDRNGWLVAAAIAGVVGVAGAAGWIVFGMEVGLPVLLVGAFVALGVSRGSAPGGEDEDLWPVEQRDERSLLHPGRGVSDARAKAAQSIHNRRPM
jgi:hypothetical protein